ncbi:MAG: hypothetical protein V4736_08030 [Bdellovibrionota bacterium]
MLFSLGKIPFNLFALTFFILTSCQTLSTSNRNPADESSSKAFSEYAQPRFMKWAQAKKEIIKNIDDANAPIHIQMTEPGYLEIPSKQVLKMTAPEAARNSQTARMYFNNFGRDTSQSLIWTGIESGNPLTRFEDYRWDSLKEQGLYDSATRKKLVATLKAMGIRNIRLGMSNHNIDIDDKKTWQATTDMINDFADGGLKISLDLHHFGIEDRPNQFRIKGKDGKTIPEISYYLHKDWPDYFSTFALRVVQKYHTKLAAITIMNEPETVVGFNGEMWHGGFPGWSHRDANRWYIERSIQVARASVKARLKIEKFLSEFTEERRPKLFFMHTEASVFKVYWEDFNLYRRFVISDLILGTDWLLSADIKRLETMPMSEIDGWWHRLTPKTRTNYHWLLENYLIYNQAPEKREKLRANLVKTLGDLQNLHKKLYNDFNITMKTNTAFAVDYYAHNEDKGLDGVKLSPEPQNYVKEMKSGNRGGLYNLIVDYYNRYKMPIMIGESGTPYYYYGKRWNEQMLLECAKAAESGVPFLGYTIYPAVDTWGWESALSVPKEHALFNPSGVLNLDMSAKPFVKPLMESLQTQMPAQ